MMEEARLEIELDSDAILQCTSCGMEDFVFSLDDKPIDESFSANYLCHDCEEIALVMQAAALSQPMANETYRIKFLGKST